LSEISFRGDGPTYEFTKMGDFQGGETWKVRCAGEEGKGGRKKWVSAYPGRRELFIEYTLEPSGKKTGKRPLYEKRGGSSAAGDTRMEEWRSYRAGRRRDSGGVKG